MHPDTKPNQVIDNNEYIPQIDNHGQTQNNILHFIKNPANFMIEQI